VPAPLMGCWNALTVPSPTMFVLTLAQVETGAFNPAALV
jgi:hypothetical protein